MESAALLMSVALGWNATTAAAASSAEAATAVALLSPSTAGEAGGGGGGGDDDGGYVSVLRCSTQHAACRASQWLYIIVCPLMLAAGTVGNFLCILTTTSRDLRGTAFGVYIASLAAVDSVAIWSALVRHFIKAVWLYDIRESGVWSCRIHRYLVYSSIDSSAWILVALTTGRLVSIRFPEGSRHHNGAARARVVVPLIVAAQLVFNVPTLWMLGDQPVANGSASHCGYPDAAAAHYWKDVQPYLSMTEASILPFLLMLAMNLIIATVLRRRNHDTNSVYRSSRQEQGQAKSGKVKAVMPLTVSFVFLGSTVPTFINTALRATLLYDKTSAVAAGVALSDTITTLLLYTNGSSNFFLYCLSGKMFRRQCRAALSSLRDRSLGRVPTDGSAFSRSRSESSAPQRNIVALRKASTWSSSGGSSLVDTPHSSPGLHRRSLEPEAAQPGASSGGGSVRCDQ